MLSVPDVTLGVAVALMCSAIVLYTYLRVICGKCRSQVYLTGKAVLITGAGSGIGYHTDLDLARRNARVIMTGRNPDNTRRAAAEVTHVTGNPEILAKPLDVSLMDSVRAFVEDFRKTESRLDILINNAGIGGWNQGLMRTAEGLEVVMATNHFGHFLLTNNLLGVTAYSLHPGIVKTDKWKQANAPSRCFIRLSGLFLKDSVEGSQTSIYCAVQEGLESYSGGYFEDCQLARPHPVAEDDDAARELWDVSERMVKAAGIPLGFQERKGN